MASPTARQPHRHITPSVTPPTCVPHRGRPQHTGVYGRSQGIGHPERHVEAWPALANSCTAMNVEVVLKEPHPYQMYAYLQSQSGHGDPVADRAEGLLLHPCTGSNIDEGVVIQRHPIRFATVDLSASSSTIRHRLLNVIEPIAGFTELS